MRYDRLDEATLVKLRELIEANVAGRDELYAAAETLAWGIQCEVALTRTLRNFK